MLHKIHALVRGPISSKRKSYSIFFAMANFQHTFTILIFNIDLSKLFQRTHKQELPGEQLKSFNYTCVLYALNFKLEKQRWGHTHVITSWCYYSTPLVFHCPRTLIARRATKIQGRRRRQVSNVVVESESLNYLIVFMGWLQDKSTGKKTSLGHTW